MSDAISRSKQLEEAHQRRLQWAIRGLATTLEAALNKDASPEAMRLRNTHEAGRIESLATQIMQRADPTSNKRFTAWLTREYAAGRLLMEDLGSANETLTLFLRYASRLDPKARDIQSYSQIADVWEVVREYAEREAVQSSRTQKAIDRARAYAESRILRQDPDGFTISVPLTQFAAKWWGRGTRWCTAAEKDNQFDEYHNEAPLVVVIIPEVGKFQFWVTPEECQLQNAADREIPRATIEKNWPRLSGLLNVLLKINGTLFHKFPKSTHTEEIYLTALKSVPGIICTLPRRLRNEDFYLRAIALSPAVLKWIPLENRTFAMCERAVLEDGELLQHVPGHFKKKLCRSAVGQNGVALMWVPEKLRNEELCRIAVSQVGSMLLYVPTDLKTDAICKIAVSQEGEALAYVPQHLRSADIVRLALAQNGFALRYLRPSERTLDLCRLALESPCYEEAPIYLIPNHLRASSISVAAIRRDATLVEFLPAKSRTPQVLLAAVEGRPSFIRGIKPRHMTEELCMAAVRGDAELLVSIPENLRTPSICKIAVDKKGHMLDYVPSQHRTKRLCLSAVQNCGTALKYVPTPHINRTICLAAVSNDGAALAYVPLHRRTMELCLAAVANAASALKYVPMKFFDRVCDEAVALNGEALGGISYFSRLAHHCRAAVAQNPFALRYVPEELLTFDLCFTASLGSREVLESFVPEQFYESIQASLPPVLPPAPHWQADLLDNWADALATTTKTTSFEQISR